MLHATRTAHKYLQIFWSSHSSDVERMTFEYVPQCNHKKVTLDVWSETFELARTPTFVFHETCADERQVCIENVGTHFCNSCWVLTMPGLSATTSHPHSETTLFVVYFIQSRNGSVLEHLLSTMANTVYCLWGGFDQLNFHHISSDEAHPPGSEDHIIPHIIEHMILFPFKCTHYAREILARGRNRDSEK